MQTRVPHHWVAELRLDGGAVLTTPALAVDWSPALAWSHFQAVRQGAARLTSDPGSAIVRPRWDAAAGPPYAAAIELVPDARPLGRPREIPLAFLSEPVRKAVSAMVLGGRIEEGAEYTWRACAFDADVQAGDGPRTDAFTVNEAEDGDEDLPRRSLADVLPRAERCGPTPVADGTANFPVLLSNRVLAEAASAAKAAGELEAGGVLLGRIARDADGGDLIVEVTAQVPASEAIAEDASLRFTPQTWQAVHAAIRLRRSSECIVGWWHSHPRALWPCRDCPADRRARCPSNRAFFSSMDVGFHRTAFAGPINVALLLSFHEDPQPRYDLFGWWQGRVAQREYYVLEENR